jgi:hypothetical protein
MRIARNAIASVLVVFAIVASVACGGIGPKPLSTAMAPNATTPQNTAPGDHAKVVPKARMHAVGRAGHCHHSSRLMR